MESGSVQRMWTIMAALGHWMLHGNIPFNVCQRMIHVDDGERICDLIGLFGCAFLTTLDSLDRAGKLKKDSDIRDLGLIISLYLEWSWGLPDYGIEGDSVAWRKSVVGYAKKDKVDLKATGCCGITDFAKRYNAVQPPKVTRKADRWDWHATVSATLSCSPPRLLTYVLCSSTHTSKNMATQI